MQNNNIVLCIENRFALFQSWQVAFSVILSLTVSRSLTHSHTALTLSLVMYLQWLFLFLGPNCVKYSVAGRPYRGKPSDMWALGVVLFTMLYGQFPFYDSIPQELFRKIKAAEYSIPE